MALADWDEYTSKLQYPDLVVRYVRGLPNFSYTDQFIGTSSWYNPGINGNFPAAVLPSTAIACDNTTVGAIPWNPSSSMSLIGADIVGDQDAGSTIIAPKSCFLFDRLSQQGGLVGNSGSTQTTNLPTAALTRYTDGVGVCIFVEGYVAAGATTGVTLNVSYTNQAGTSGRTGKMLKDTTVILGAVAGFHPVALQSGDTGVRSVESVTWSGPTNAAGNFGITLAKPLAFLIPSKAGELLTATEIPGWSSVISSSACLQLISNNSSSGAVPLTLDLKFIAV